LSPKLGNAHYCLMFLKTSKYFPSLKILGIPALLLFPLVVIVLVFSPFSMSKAVNNSDKLCRLPAHFTMADVVAVSSHMKEKEEFYFYYHSLSREQIERAIQEVYEILTGKTDQESFYKAVAVAKDRVESVAVIFNSLEYSDEYLQRPFEFPNLNRMLVFFIYEDFKTSLLGMCYKGTFDKNFHFEWKESSQEAAQRMRNIMAILTADKKERIRKNFSSTL
jgi:hypothetical protein